MYPSFLTYKYNNKDRPPFIMQVQPEDETEISSLHPLHMSRIISQISPHDIVEIRKTGRSRIVVEMRNLQRRASPWDRRISRGLVQNCKSIRYTTI